MIPNKIDTIGGAWKLAQYVGMGVCAMVTVNGNAKINLTLDILGTREDGFHEVSMVMQEIDLHDTLELEKTGEGISLEIDAPGLEADERNLAWKAAALMMEEYAIKGGVRIKLAKHIPIAAGLAGGSADAAAVLCGMNQLYGLGLSKEELCKQGARLGSDIPFCIMGGTMLATGRGEMLRALPECPEAYVVLAKPPVSVSTAWAYQQYDSVGSPKHPDNEAMEEVLQKYDIIGVAKLLCNVLENVTIKKYEMIEQYKKIMLEQGAMASMMSGSGPTVFALARTKSEAENIAACMKERTEADIFVAKTVGRAASN